MTSDDTDTVREGCRVVRAGLDASTTGGMTARLDRLAQAGWMERHPDPDDGRRERLASLLRRLLVDPSDV
jgi:hypothetical protein